MYINGYRLILKNLKKKQEKFIYTKLQYLKRIVR